MGHDGEKLVLCVFSGYPETKKIENDIQKLVEKHFDPEFKIGGMTILQYLHDKRGFIASKRFGF